MDPGGGERAEGWLHADRISRMAVRATQGVVASLSIVGAAHTQTSQIVVAAMVASAASVRASAVQINALLGHPDLIAARARASWLVIEAIVWSIDPFTGKPASSEAGMPDTFPVLPGLSYSVIKRPKFFTGIGTSATGREVRVGYAPYPLWEWDLTFGYLPDKVTESAATPSDLKQLLGFYLSQQGALNGFWFKDPDDYSVTGQPIATADGVTTNFLLLRTYGGTAGSGTEPIGGVGLDAPFRVYLNGVLQSEASYDVVLATPVAQYVRFHSPPASGAVVTIDMNFVYYCRFKDDTYDFEKFMDKFWSQRLITLASQRG
jgi:uncharacterized protein (TIGR02217 family)